MSETPVSALAVYTARPTVRIDTQAYPLVSELLESMEMVEAEGGLSSLELIVRNLASDETGEGRFAFEDDQLLKLGAAIAIYAGDETAPTQIFDGWITGLEAEFGRDHPPRLTVLAEDAAQRARMSRRSQVYEDATLAAIAREVAGRMSLQPVITGFTESIGTQVQMDESDLAFLRRLLACYDGDLQVVAGELHVSPRADVQRNALDLALSGQLLSARVLADLTHQVSTWSVTGWDAEQGSRIRATGQGVALGPGAGRTGAQVLDETLGTRAHHLSHLATRNRDEAQAIADAAFDSRARRFIVLEGTSEGNPAIRVGTHLNISGLGARFSNTYYVARACHRFDLGAGYQTDFEAECAYLGIA